MKCRFCDNTLKYEFLDLVNAPPSNSYLSAEQLYEPEIFYPLKLFICEKCFLVQIDEYKKSDDIFNQNYAYFSSFSSTWLLHAKTYVDMIIKRIGLGDNSFVIEIASNDGYLLQYFAEKKIPCLGIEPTASTATAAREKGIETIEEFFNTDLASKLVQEGKQADLIIGNNVLSHVPNINNFVYGLHIVLKKDGVITMEFPHLMQLIEAHQFDTIYHEHFSYLSFHTISAIFEKNSLVIFDVEELSTHGGSLRIYACHKNDHLKSIQSNVTKLLEKESKKGLMNLEYYLNFQNKVDQVKHDFLQFLLEQKKLGKKVVAYGAAAKGNTLLNYCGVKPDLISFVVDASPHKQGKYLPGSHIRIVHEKRIKQDTPDFVVILPWNIKDEIIEQLNYIRSWGGRFIIVIPKLFIF